MFGIIYPEDEVTDHELDSLDCLCKPELLEVCDCEDGCYKCKNGYVIEHTYDGPKLLVHNTLISHKSRWICLEVNNGNYCES